MHGGKIPNGRALPQTKHGRYSRYLPERLTERYLESRSDPDLLALRDEVAIVDSRLNDLLDRVDSGESGALWLAAQNALRRFESADRADNTTKRYEALFELRSVLESGAQDYAAWAEIQLLLEQRRKLVETERKRLVDMQQMITAERAMLLIAAISDTIRRHVSDRNVLAAINADLGALINRPAP